MSRARKLAIVASPKGDLDDPGMVAKTADYLETLANESHALIYEVRDELEGFFFESLPASVDHNHANDALTTMLRIIRKIEANTFAAGGAASDIRSHLERVRK